MPFKIGHITSEETKHKISIANKGHSVSKETREKISKSHKGTHRTFKNPAERKLKISIKHKGKIFSTEHKLKLSKAHLGKIFSDSTKAKMREAQLKRVKAGLHNYYKGGITKNKKYVSWSKNKRNRLRGQSVKLGFNHTWEEWNLLKIKYNLTCPYCHKSEPEIKLTIDHIIPLSKGGLDSIDNIQPLCLTCNIKKGNKLINNNFVNGINKIQYLSQRDPRWSAVKIGVSNTPIGRMGCLITCLSMLSDYFGCYQTPAEIATNPKNFSGDDNISWVKLNFPTFSFRWREGSLFSNEPLNLEMIKSYMAKKDGNPDRAVILEVADHSHWVLALWTTFDGDILAIDPWTGKTCEVYKTYKNITGASLFVRWTNKNKKAWQGKMKPEAPNYN